MFDPAKPERAKRMPPTIVWFRDDLRVADNPALAAAAAGGAQVVPVYVLDEVSPGLRSLGGAAKWWLHGSLAALDAALVRLGPGHALPPRLVLRRGAAADVLAALARETGARAVYWNRRYGPAAKVDARVEAVLRGAGVETASFNASALREPWEVRTGAGRPYKVFTPFWNACLALGEPAIPEPAPRRLTAFAPAPASERLDDWALRPTVPDWAGGLRAAWQPGEAGAVRRLAAFLEDGLTGYAEARDRPDLDGTARLSPHLRFGEIGPRQVWHAVRTRAGDGPDAEAFLRELGWRDFALNLLHQQPDMDRAPLRPEFERFPWRDDTVGLRAWQRGGTGYPIVDAGMRALWHTGWMHNRVRMVVASFLVKDLRVDWRLGEAWFWDTLVDADAASNPVNWQWVAGCGADAAPYFRIFNPVTQGRKFDPDGGYARRWVPELDALPARHVHAPWLAPRPALEQAGVRLGETYPAPIVDHAAARRAALDAFESLRGGATDPS